MADLSNNYGLSEGVDCRNGAPVFNKLSCQSLRVFPAPPGYWEESIHLPIRGDGDDGPEAKKRRDALYRGAMFGDPNFVSCKHPDCWICMGQATPPTEEQITAFSFEPPSGLGRPLPCGLLSGERESLYGKRPKKRSILKHLAMRAVAFFRRPWGEEAR